MSDQKMYALALEARILTGAMMQIVRSDLDRHLKPFGIGGWLQRATMGLLSEQQMTISELSKRLRVEPATLVPVVDALERDGFARRGQDPNDRRRTPLSLTERGLEVLRQVPAVHQEDILLNAFQQMGRRRSNQYVALLRELMGYMSKDQTMVRQVTETAQRQIAHEHNARRDVQAAITGY